MVIPAWVEDIFQRVVVVFEAPASETLEAAGSTALLPWLDSLLTELPLLVKSVQDHVFPTGFLTNALGFSPERAARLPALMTLFIIFYILCGAATVFLRLRRNQFSPLKFSHQSFNAVLIWSCMLLLPMRKALMASGDASIYPKLALIGIVFAIAMPLASVIRYIWVYRLFGIPHAVFDAGFGFFSLSVFLLSVKTGKILFFLIFLAMAALTYIQWEPDEDEDLPVRTTPPAETAAPAAPRTPVAAARESAPVRESAAPIHKSAESVRSKTPELKAKLAALLLFLRQRFEILITKIRMVIVSYRRSQARRNVSARPAQASAPAPHPAAEPVAEPIPELSTMELDIDSILAAERETRQ